MLRRWPNLAVLLARLGGKFGPSVAAATVKELAASLRPMPRPIAVEVETGRKVMKVER